MSDLLEELKARTVAGVQPARGLNYNYPTRLFMRPDGMVVALQGDPQNRAYYRDKGFVELSEARPVEGGLSERQRYEREYHPQIVAQQRKKAEAINRLRAIGQRNPAINVDYPFEQWTAEQCEDILRQVSEKTGMPAWSYEAVLIPDRAPTEDRLLIGVETADQASLEGLQAKLNSQHGYDPIDEANRPLEGDRGFPMAEKKTVDHRDDVLDTQEGPVYQANTLKGAQSGPHEQVDPNLYHTYTKPDGSTFVAPDSSREYYERKGYKVTADEVIEDWVAWVEEHGKQDAPAEPKAKAKNDAPGYLPTPENPAPPVGTEPAKATN